VDENGGTFRLMEREKVHLIDILALNKNEGEWKFYILQDFINR
jgi:hypothetical protein